MTKLKNQRKSKKLMLLFFSIGFLAWSLLPVSAFADGADTYWLSIIANYVKGEMMEKLHQYQQEATNKITGKLNDDFQQEVNWENWPASLKELFVEQGVKLENQGNQISYKNAQDYLSYTQGKASGVDAQSQPAALVQTFNKDYNSVQQQNTNCQLNVPQPIGDTSKNCTPAQTQFTNYLITGVHPMPNFPDDSTQTSVGQQYQAEQKVADTRMALAQMGLDQSTNDKTNQFIQYMQQNLQNPSLSQINSESSTAIARDTLIMEQARAIIALKEYETTLMNERLLSTIVSQNEDIHMQQIRELANHIH